MGLMIGVEMTEDIAKTVQKRLQEKGILVGAVGSKILRLVPPLIVTEPEVDLFMDRLSAVFNELEKGA